MGFVVKRGDKYSARLVIPKALRPILGQNEFKKSLGTSSKTEADEKRCERLPQRGTDTTTDKRERRRLD